MTGFTYASGGVSFIVPGKPIGKARPRFTRQGRVYTTSKTTDREKQIAAAAREAFPDPLDGPVSVAVEAIIEPAKSWSKKRKAAVLWRPHESKPDGDNILKLALDAMNGIAYRDDSQVAEMKVSKTWGAPARTVIRIQKLPNGVER